MQMSYKLMLNCFTKAIQRLMFSLFGKLFRNFNGLFHIRIFYENNTFFKKFHVVLSIVFIFLLIGTSRVNRFK